ncbi:MAG: hypothetical protein QNI89_02280 [Desulfobacterales bacterium]|nr:hypothetical protein [Desulfobacterales bacterium]
MGRFNRLNIVLLVAGAMLAASLLAIMLWLDQPLRTSAAPRGIVSFELAGSSAAAREILASWGPEARRNAALSLQLDYAFLVAYATVLFLLCAGVARQWPRSPAFIRRVGFILAGGQWLAAALDAGENILLQMVLSGAAAPALPLAARWCALGKFGLIACAWLYIVAAGGALVVRRLRDTGYRPGR